MDVFCVGMYRSCSTWQYNIVSELVEKYRGGVRLGSIAGRHYLASEADTDGGPRWRTLKSHHGHANFGKVLAEGKARAVYSYRDLRDVAYSLMHKHSSTFEELIVERKALQLCLYNDDFWTSQSGVLCQQYEQILADPVHSVKMLAAHLDISLSDVEAEQLAARHSLEANRERTAELASKLQQEGVNLRDPGNTLRDDRHSLLQWNHIRHGRSGSWKEQVTSKQLPYLAAVCGDWLIERGYETGEDWWKSMAGDDPQVTAEIRRLRIKFQVEAHQAREQLDRSWIELRRTDEPLANLQAALDRLRDLGPTALGVAERVHRISVKYPRIAAAVKWMTRRKRSETNGNHRRHDTSDQAEVGLEC